MQKLLQQKALLIKINANFTIISAMPLLDKINAKFELLHQMINATTR